MRIPVSVVFTEFQGPGDLVFSASGPSTFTQDLTLSARAPVVDIQSTGLQPASGLPIPVQQSATQTFSPADPTTGKFTFNIPGEGFVVGFALFGAQYAPSTDLDMFLFDRSSKQVAGSGNAAGQDEFILLSGLKPDDYSVYIHGYDLAGEAEINANLYAWILDINNPINNGVMTVTPAAVATDPLGFATAKLSFDLDFSNPATK